jgi:hypothetical protein
MNAPETLKCATHPDVETNLRCGKCGKPICPRCMVQTPVGARCRDCARLHKLPTYRLSPAQYLRASGAALGTAIAAGAVWGIIQSYLRSGLFLIIGIAVGYGVGIAIGEVISRSVNRKRGSWLPVIGVAAIVICYGVVWLVSFLRFGFFVPNGYQITFTLMAVGYGSFTAVVRLR